ncbi:MAG: hypothetical protein WC757_03720 [Candidatus Paceibacterota bacterium]|jgi:hypothetical protein
MFIVRETFTAKPGHARELANIMKEPVSEELGSDVVVMLDYVTNYNTVVIEYRVKNLADFESMTEKMRSAARGKPPAPYTELYTVGKRDIFKIVE